MSETILDIPHFSKKLMSLSLLLVAIHFSFLGLRAARESVLSDYLKVAPQVVFVGSTGVEMKTIFDPEFRPAQKEEVLSAGTILKTDDQNFAEIVLASTILRLDPGTELKLLANEFEVPRLRFELFRGGVWVRARQEVIFETPRASALFSGALGYYRLERPSHEVRVIQGGADLALYDANGEPLTAFFIPPGHQVRFSESQITRAYSKLQPSKLKKELKLNLLSGADENDPWVKRQMKEEGAKVALSSSFAFLNFFRESWALFRSRFALSPEEKSRAQVQVLELELDVLFLAISKNPAPQKADLLQGLQALLSTSDPIFLPTVKRAFRQVSAATASSPFYLLKEALRQYLIRVQKDPVFFRTYLTDLEQELERGQVIPASSLEAWQKLWNEASSESHYPEFERQLKTLFSLILAHPRAVSLELFVALKPLEETLLKHTPDFAETLFALLDFRLDFSSALLDLSHAPLAQTVLKSAVQLFNENGPKLSGPGRDVFLSRAEILFQQIEFVRTELHGSAEDFDEAAFRQYRERKARDETITRTLESLLREEEEEAVFTPPSLQEVTMRFAQARISVIEENLERNEEDPFSFSVREARLIDRGDRGGFVTFSAIYDYRTNAAHEIQVKGKPLSGNFSLQDLVVILTRRESASASRKTEDLLGLTEDLSPRDDEEALRSQAVAQDLASQLVMEAFRQASIGISGSQNLEPLDASNLNEFRVKEATVTLPLSGQNRRVAFRFRLDFKEARDIRMLDEGISLPGPLTLTRLPESVENALKNARDRDQALREVYDSLRSKGFSLTSKDLIPEGGNRFRFEHLKFLKVPLELGGVYDASTQKFPELQHELLSANDTLLEPYLEDLVSRYLVAFFAERGVTLDPATFKAVYPFPRLQVKGFKAGKSLLDFDVNVAGNRLEQVSIQGEEAAVPTMAFEEFKSILNTFETEAAN